MLKLYKPEPEDLWFKEKLMNDEETMSYNARWGGTIPFPKTEWSSWYASWMKQPETQRFYRYLQEEQSGEFVGEIAWRLDPLTKRHCCNIIILFNQRRQGYGSEGIALLLQMAKQYGLTELWDEIAADNSSINLFFKNGFMEVTRTEESILVKKQLDESADRK